MLVPRTAVYDVLDDRLSSILIIGTEYGTSVKLVVIQSVKINAFKTTLIPGNQYSFTIDRLETVYIRSFDDLTGTKIIIDKPVSVFSGHGCGNVPWNIKYSNYLIEQIPPTALWGKVHYVAPLVNKTSYTIKILAAYNFTILIAITQWNPIQSVKENSLIKSNTNEGILYVQSTQAKKC